jgi:hypothetical protein
MAKSGYLDGSRMAGAFNMLRPNDLIWSYAVNNYLKGKAPTAFDLLYWNSDSTRMPAANHSFYLRNCYLENKLSKGEMQIGGKTLDLKKVTIPIYNLAPAKTISRRRNRSSRLAMLRRSRRLRRGGFGPYRRRRQPASQGQVPVLDRRQAAGSSRKGRSGLADWFSWRGAGAQARTGHPVASIRAPGGRTGSLWIEAQAPKLESGLRASPEAASWRPLSETRRSIGRCDPVCRGKLCATPSTPAARLP